MADRAAERTSELNLVTLGLAALASVIATVGVARLGLAGSILGAALAPVIITLVKEYGRKPITGVAAIGQAARKAGRARPAEARPPVTPLGAEPAPITIHRTPRHRLARVRWGRVIVTSAIAFVVAVGVFTIPDLIAGQSIVSGRDTTFFSTRDPGPAAQAPAAGEETDSEQPADEATPQDEVPEEGTETGTAEPQAPEEEAPVEEAPEAEPIPEAAPVEPAPAPEVAPVEPAPAPAP